MKNVILTLLFVSSYCSYVLAGCQWDYFPQTQSIYDVYFDACEGWDSDQILGILSNSIETTQSIPELSFSRQVILQNGQIFHTPNFPSHAKYNGENMPFKVKVKWPGSNTYEDLSSNSTYAFFWGTGEYSIKFKFIYGILNGIVKKEVRFVVKQSAFDYQDNLPDDIWRIQSNEIYQIPCSNAYSTDPTDRLSKYSQNSYGEANVYIRYGEGNSKITRPIIFVEGADFKETSYFDPALDNQIVRHGDNGWENVIQGLSENLNNDGSLENFRNYPEMLNKLRTDESDGINSNYDIILVDFKDGADYIQKNSQLLSQIIEQVNDEKDCNYENIVLGLSMGGQIARHALRTMEIEGKDHQSRMYFSFDSPHIMANIPLALQAFVWQNANIFGAGQDQSNATVTAQNSWYNGNRPAALQMLEYSLNGEYQKGNLDIDIKKTEFINLLGSIFIESDPEVEIIDAANYFDPSLDYSCLRNSYKTEMEALGYPEQAMNVAVANGAGNGSNQGFNDGDLLIRGSVFSNLVHVVLRAGNGDMSNTIYDSVIPDFTDLKLIDCKVRLNSSMLFLDGVAGCSRNDIGNSVKQALEDGGLSILNNEFQSNFTFMPTSSVIGYETTNFFEDINGLLPVLNNLTPFDHILVPNENEPHVFASNDNIDYLGDILNEGRSSDFQELTSLPNEVQGSKYNFGLYHKRVPSFLVKNNGVLSFNKSGYTGFTESFPEGDAVKNQFNCAIVANTCGDPSTVTVDKGGKMILGEKFNPSKSARVSITKDASIHLKAGSFMELENASELVVDAGGNLTIDADANVNLKGQDSRLLIRGDLITTGDVTITCNGSIVVGQTANIQLGGKLTIIGDNQNDLLLQLKSTLSTTHDIEILNGTIELSKLATLDIHLAENVNFSKVQLKIKDIINSQNGINAYNVSNINIDGFKTKNFWYGTPLNITGNYQSQLNISEVEISNCLYAIRSTNIDEVSIENSNFNSTSFQIEDENTPEWFNGVYIANSSEIHVLDSYFEGFGTDGDDDAVEFALQLINGNKTTIENSVFVNNAKAIDVPNTGSTYERTNKTNLFFKSSTLKLNFIGIEMYGYASKMKFEYSWGFLYLECAKILDNYRYGVLGEDILLKADNFVGGEDGYMNYFRGSVGSLKTDIVPVIMRIGYYDYSFDEILLRGNAWWKRIPELQFYDGQTYANIEPILDPMYLITPSTPMFESCKSVQDPNLGDDFPCEDCYDLNQNSCIINAQQGSDMMNILREGLDAISNGNLDLSGMIFEEIASMEKDNTLPNACRYAYDVSRVFSLPNDHYNQDSDFENRSSSKFKGEWDIYPNPNQGLFKLNAFQSGRLEILGMNKNQVLVMHYNPGDVIDLQQVPSGIYIIRITNKNGEVTQKKLVIQH